MRTRATTEVVEGTTGGPVAPVTLEDVAAEVPVEASPGRWRRLVARLRGDYEEDGTFRPVRLTPWVDLLVSLGIVIFMAACFVGFFAWLAMTQ